MLLVLLVIFTLLGENLILGAARRVPLLSDQVEHSLSHPRVLGEHQLYNLRHSRWMMYLGGNLDNFYFEHRVAVASILVNKDYTELTLHLLQATFFGFSKTQIPENISRWWRRFFRKFSLTRENCLLSKSSWWCFVRGPGPGYKKSLEFQRRSGSWAA